MRILGFDTATRATTVALCDFDAGAEPGASVSATLELQARDDPRSGERPRHATRLMASIVELLGRAGSQWDEIDRIAVGVGPGSFTGLRIGVATARALAWARAIELVGVSTLQSLAHAQLQSLALGAQLQSRAFHAQHHPGPSEGPGAGPLAGACDAVLAVLDARRGEVFAAGWRAEQGDRTNARQGDRTSAEQGDRTNARQGDRTSPWQPTQPMAPLLAPRALSPNALAELIPELGRRVVAVGDGAVGFRGILERSGAQIPEDESGHHRVTAISHCRLACSLSSSAADEIFPEYLRLPDAEIARQAAGRK